MRRSGFSLIELIVVIGVLLILAAVVFPVFSRSKMAAAGTHCMTNLSQAGTAVHLYAADYEDRLPFAAHIWTLSALRRGYPVYGEPLDSILREAPSLQELLAKYGTVAAQFRCPVDHCLNYGRGDQDCSTSTFETTGASYVYDETNGLSARSLTSFSEPSASYLLGDAANWHVGSRTSVLFIDGHVRALSWEARTAAFER
jgi:prepilin-type N-terminal cleavage/methylation domain-containing protein/prepilin-type processing-associated H-X9-DG protein